MNSAIEADANRTPEVRKESIFALLLRRTEEIVRSKRDAKALHSVFATWMSRAVTYALRFAIVGLSIRILGRERYGLWLTIGSLTAWLNLSDIGISGALLSRVATAYTRGEFDVVRCLISSANRLYWGVAALAAGVALTLAAFPRVVQALGANGANIGEEGRWLLVVTGLLFGITIRASTVVQVSAALNEGYLNSYARTLSWLISFVILVLARPFVHSTVSYALIIVLPTACEPFVLGHFLYRRPPYCNFRPAARYFDRKALRDLLGLSVPMLQTQIADLVVNTSANVLIAHRLGLLAVPRFAVPWSLFWIFIGPLGTIFYSYWPPYVQAFTNGEFVWLRRRFLRMLAIVTAGLCVANAMLVFVGPGIVRQLAGASSCPDRTFFAVTAVYFVLSLIAYALGMLSMATNQFKLRGVTRVGVAAFHIIGFMLGVNKFGITAFPIAGGIALILEILILALASFKSLYLSEARPEPATATA